MQTGDGGLRSVGFSASLFLTWVKTDFRLQIKITAVVLLGAVGVFAFA